MNWKMTMKEFIVLVFALYFLGWFIAIVIFESNLIIYYVLWIPTTLYLNLHNFIDYKYIEIVWRKDKKPEG